jgi:hypothetical protein
MSKITVRIPSLLEDIAQYHQIPKTVSVYVYDSTPSMEVEFEFQVEQRFSVGTTATTRHLIRVYRMVVIVRLPAG